MDHGWIVPYLIKQCSLNKCSHALRNEQTVFAQSSCFNNKIKIQYSVRLQALQLSLHRLWTEEHFIFYILRDCHHLDTKCGIHLYQLSKRLLKTD